MAEFNLGRLRFVWKGEWVTGTSYLRDDVIRYGGSSYVCKQGHTAQSNFYADRDLGSWEIMAGGFEWEAEWQGNFYYKVGNVVRYGVSVYLCISGHTSDATTFENDGANWEILVSGLNWRDTWGALIQYQTNELVIYNDRVYIALTDNIGADPEVSASDWRQISGTLGQQDHQAMSASLIPDTDIAYDLGNATYRWRDLYLSGNTIFLGDVALSVTVDGKISAAGGFDLGGTEQLTNGDIVISGNVLETVNSNASLDVRTSGTGAINLEANTNITGNLDVTGDITLGGNLRIGDQDVDTVEVRADFTSNIVPDTASTYDLGSSAKTWQTVYADAAALTNSITTTNTGTVDVFNTNATGANILGAATAISLGAGTGTTTINHALTVTGAVTFTTVPTVPNGGTGLNTITENGIMFGNGTGNVGVTAASVPGSNATTSYGILTTDGSNVPVWTDVIDEGTY